MIHPRELFCYVIILALTIVPLAIPRTARSRLPGPASQPGDIRPPTTELLLQGRTIVGYNVLVRSTHQPLPPQTLDSMRQAAQTPADHFRELLVERELGDGRADDALRSLASDHPELWPDVDTALDGKDATPADRQALVARHGWFGELALTKDEPSSDPQRQHVIAAAMRSIFGSLTMVGLGLVAAFIGLVLLIIFIVFWAQGKIRPRLPMIPTLPTATGIYLESFTLYLAILTVVPLIVEHFMQPTPWIAVAFYIGAPAAAVAWAMLRGQSWRDIREAAGLRLGAKRRFFREVGAGILGYMMGLPVMAIGVMITLMLSRLVHADPTHPIVNELSTDPRVVALLLLLAAVYAPLVEESLFRGFFFIHLRRRLGPYWGAGVVALIFAAIHPQGWTAIPTLGALGFTFAMMREFRGSAIANMTAHALNNGMLLVLLTFALS